MKSFQFQLPTDIRFGEGVIDSIGTVAADTGNSALLVYGGGSIKRNGVYDTITSALHAAGVSWTEYSGVQPNPILSHAEQGVRLAREAAVDMIIAAGGGSVIDEAKTIAIGASDDVDLWDFYTRARSVAKALPLLAVQTLPASSSEVNPVSVLTNDRTMEKFSVRSPLIFPKTTFLDPAVTVTIPIQQTAYACTDILSHMMEGYFTTTDSWVPVQDGMTEGISRAIIASFDRVTKNPADIDARATIMWGGALAWSGLVNAGLTGAGVPNHMLEHPMSAYHDITHGAGLSIIIPGWLKFMRDRIAPRIIRFGEEVLRLGSALEGKSESDAADLVINNLETWYRRIGTPVTFSEGGITEPRVDDYTKQALVLGKAWGIPGYTENDIREVYRICGA